MKSKMIMSYRISLQSGNKLGSVYHSCLISLFTISYCTVFFTFHRFSIWSIYLLIFFLFIIHWKETLHFEIIYASSLYAKYLLKFQVLKLLVYFCTKKYSTRGALGRFDGEVIRVKEICILSLTFVFTINAMTSAVACDLHISSPYVTNR